MCLSSATFSGKSLELRDPVRGAGMGGANGLCTEPGAGGGGVSGGVSRGVYLRFCRWQPHSNIQAVTYVTFASSDYLSSLSMLLSGQWDFVPLLRKPPKLTPPNISQI